MINIYHLRMIKPLERIINRGFRKDMDYITSDKSVSIHVTLRVTDVEKSMEVYPEGLRMVVMDGWKMFCLDSPIHITTSIDVL
jgi:hypothetical protein